MKNYIQEDYSVKCACCSIEHILHITYTKEDNTIYLQMHLTKLPILKRLSYAIKYIFGYQSCFGAFEEVILDDSCKKDINKLIKTLKKIK